ncbi:MAG TPA: hypothetical protein PKI11_05870 [Candidatus Hydrogenedentes bacterium]|nr:hypothetical protein [Candidatus Hydrogenedentota bacterium]
MQCPRHTDQEVIGYCAVCGEFGCADCLREYAGGLYCRMHMESIVSRIRQHAVHTEQAKERPKLVARLLTGSVLRGYSLRLNPEERGFHLEEVSEQGADLSRTRYVPFHELKAVFVVRSFGPKANGDDGAVYWRPSGEDLVVRFRDGETLCGRAHQPGRTGPPRFVMIPEDTDSNNLAVLAEYTALEGVYSPEAYQEKLGEELRTCLVNHSHDGMSKEEVSGDFYFAHHDYARALEHYRRITHLAPRSHRIRKKLIATEYNLAAGHARRREYEEAHACIMRILDLDPHHEKAREKARVLHHAMKKARAERGA